MYAAYSSILHSKEKTGRILGTWHQYLMNFRASALLHNIQNIRICMGEKTYRFCNQRKWKDFNKKQFTLLKMCVTSLLCGPRADLWTFSGFLCKRFYLYIKVYPGGGGTPTHNLSTESESKVANLCNLSRLKPSTVTCVQTSPLPQEGRLLYTG